MRWDLPPENKFGVPRLPRAEDNGTRAGAFLLRLRTPAAGSIPDPRGVGHLVAFGTACTHMGCLLVRGEGAGEHDVGYDPPSGDRPEKVVCGPCPCHGTSFDLTREGLVILGPATQNLPQLVLEIDGNQVVSRPEGVVDPRDESWPLAAGGGASP